MESADPKKGFPDEGSLRNCCDLSSLAQYISCFVDPVRRCLDSFHRSDRLHGFTDDILQLVADERLGYPENRRKFCDHVASCIELTQFLEQHRPRKHEIGHKDLLFISHQLGIKRPEFGKAGTLTLEEYPCQILNGRHPSLGLHLTLLVLDAILASFDPQDAAQLVQHVHRLGGDKGEGPEDLG